ncbi:hypothetical protein [Azospirillum sp.]|uniref:hypothetical protein n=1 Tax=Azospirillum sp. TaxID=34012 RepID=UPI003D714E44
MPVLIVASAVADRSLVSLATLKTELGISGTDYDAKLTAWGKAASDIVCSVCGIAADQQGRRTLITEAFTVSYRASEVPQRCGDPAPLLLPWRLPLTISAVTADGTALTVVDDVECEPMAGLLWRLDEDGERTHWTRGRITITASAGWAQDDVPEAARQAVIRYVRERYDGDGRNSLLKAEESDGVGRDEYWIGPTSKGDALPADMVDALRASGLVNVAIG